MEKEKSKAPEEITEGALADLLVIDLTTARSGPTCTKILADFGADVIRVERPSDLSDERYFYDQADLHRNKKSILLNLQDKQGVEIFYRLAKRADVVVENYRPDVKHSLGHRLRYSQTGKPKAHLRQHLRLRAGWTLPRTAGV